MCITKKLRVPIKRKGKFYGYKLVPDKGKPGRTPKSKKWFKPKRRLGNSRIGYWSKSLPAKKRRRILDYLVKKRGYATVIRELNALRNVSTDRETDKACTSDMYYLKRKYRPKGYYTKRR
jgi:hypothetical protein